MMDILKRNRKIVDERGEEIGCICREHVITLVIVLAVVQSLMMESMCSESLERCWFVSSTLMNFLNKCNPSDEPSM